MRRLLAALFILFALTAQAPFGAFTGVTNGTITVTNTFQSIITQNTNRRGCTIQNTGTHTMFVFFGAIGSATTSNSIQINGGQIVNCQVGGIILQDAVSITGTAGDPFVVNIQ